MTRKTAEKMLSKAAAAIGDADDWFQDESQEGDDRCRIALRVPTESGMVWLSMEYEPS